MTMVGDMFNNNLKSKLDAVCTELAEYAAHARLAQQSGAPKDSEVSYRSQQTSDWWPAEWASPAP
jgi:hypothetical protein